MSSIVEPSTHYDEVQKGERFTFGGNWSNYLKNALLSQKTPRGMNLLSDLKDWLSGYPFEEAKPEEVFVYFRDRGYHLEELKTVGGRMGCNEFVFKKAEKTL